MRNNNGKIWRILAIVLVVLFAAFSVVYSYGQLNNRVEDIEKEVEIAKDTRERVIRIEADIGYIKEVVDDIKKDLQNAQRGTSKSQ